MQKQASTLWLVLSSFCCVCAGLACSRPTEPGPPERRQLLKSPDQQAQKAQVEKRHVLSEPDGKLLPSDDSIAGLQLPRGVWQVAADSVRTTYHSFRGVTFDALDRYFSERLFTGQVERPLPGGVAYVNASIKNAPKAPHVTVRITRLSSGGECEVLVEPVPPRPPPLTPEQANALTRKQLSGPAL